MSEIFEPIQKVKLKTIVWISMYLIRNGESAIETYDATDSEGCMYYLKLNRERGWHVVTFAIGITKKDAERLLTHKVSESKNI